MNIIPLTVLDNFFENPDKIRKWALSLNYESDPANKWPGKRTKFLHEIDNNFFMEVCNKILSLYMTEHEVYFQTEFLARASFQLVDSTKHSNGWIHADAQDLMTAIIYLNPNGHINSGTSLYKLKNDVISPSHNFYKDLDFSIDQTTLEDNRLKNNDQYEETVKIGGNYNRLIVFDSSQYHSANEFKIAEDDNRLTLIIFFNKVKFDIPPADRSRRIKAQL